MLVLLVALFINATVSARLRSKDTATELEARAVSLSQNRHRRGTNEKTLETINEWINKYATALAKEVSHFDHLISRPEMSKQSLIANIAALRELPLKHV